MEEPALRDRIEALVGEERELLNRPSEDDRRHQRLEAIQTELDTCWDVLRRRQAGQTQTIADADVPDPPNDLEGPDPEPPHLDHGVHEDGPKPDPGINPNVP